MFITAKSALIDAGAHRRWMPFDCTVQYRQTLHGDWVSEVKGRSTDFLAEVFTDLRGIWPSARMINSETGQELFRG